MPSLVAGLSAPKNPPGCVLARTALLVKVFSWLAFCVKAISVFHCLVSFIARF